MKFVESLLVSVVFIACVFSTLSDLRAGIIENKLLKRCGLIAMWFVVLYYGAFCRNLIGIYFLNLFMMVLISSLMYKLNLWAAGDTKLVMLISAIYPARLYGSGLVPMISIIVLSFGFAFIYVVFETLYLSIKNNERVTIDVNLLKENITRFLFGFMCIYVFDVVVAGLFSAVRIDNTLLSFINLFLSIALLKRYVFLSKRIKTIGIFALIIAVSACLCFAREFVPDWRTIAILLLLLIMQMICEKYNYLAIETSHVERGMILSTKTVLKFMDSRVKGLPSITTEDMKSRISDEEVDAIKRWEYSKKGESSILIVRKMPFALFIFVGTLLYFLRGIL